MGLVFRGFARLERVDPGFSRRAAATIQLSLPPRRYADREALSRFHDALARRLRALPGSRAVGAVSLLPLTGLLSTVDYVVPDRPAPSPADVPQAHFRVASEGYFDAAGIRLVEGRQFTEDDGPRGAPVAVISRTLARRQWPEGTSVGRHLRIADAPDSPLLEVVGVVDDVKQFRLEGASTADLYVPIRQMPTSAVPALAARMYWVIATNGDALLKAAALRREVRAVDPDVAGSSVRTLEEVITGSLGPRRLNARLLELFGFAALALSAIGVYGTTAFSVGARQRDLALRAAFGATPPALMGLVLRQELRPVLVGLAAGLSAGLFVARLLADALFATSPSDPLVYLAVGTGLFTTAAVACSLPARRGARADPARLLRA
jgi:putative ABC transport system permease protein